MPFDDFFSSKNKRHYVEVDGVNELYQKLNNMSEDDRKQEMASWRGRELTKVEWIVRRKIAFDLQRKRREAIFLDYIKTDRKVRSLLPKVHGGYSGTGLHKGRTQHRGFRH